MLLFTKLPLRPHGEGSVTSLSTLPTSSLPGSQRRIDWSAFGHSSSHSVLCAEIGRKRKKEWLFLIGVVVSFLFVDYCHVPGCPSLSYYCTVGCLRGWACMSLLESLVGASLLHNLLNLILFMYLLRPEALHLASSPFL